MNLSIHQLVDGLYVTAHIARANEALQLSILMIAGWKSLPDLM